MQQIFTIFILLTTASCLSQTISFTDAELKRYLINEACVDTTFNGVSFSNDINVDLNNDNEIQLSEALSVLKLDIWDIQDNYSIKSLHDINSFSNLSYLRIMGNDSITEVSNLSIDSLSTLWIGSCVSLESVDISNLSGLTKDLRIEDIDTLDYLNIQNGSSPQYFSLFYSDHIHYACVDSIASEYSEVAWKMISGQPMIDNCSLLNTTDILNKSEPPMIFPNPTFGIVKIDNLQLYDKVTVVDINGEFMRDAFVFDNQIDLTRMQSGIYFLVFELNELLTFKKVVKM